MTNFHTINDSRDYMNYFFNIGARGITETTAEIMGMSNTIRNAIGNLAFKTSEYLGQAESVATGFALTTVASFASATKSAAEFQQAVASVEAISGKQLSGSMIGERAMQMSNKFGLATTEMTQGLEALARAGITANNSINALLESGVQMTKFEGRDLEESINDILSTTNLLNPDLNPDSDEFAQTVRDLNQQIISTSESSPINAKNIMDTLQHVGGYASSMGLNQDDLFATIAQLGAKGTKGEIAGTSLRAFLSAGQKDTAQRALSRIGLTVADLWDENQQNILPVSEMKRVLDEALESNGFTTQEKIEFYSDFVGYKQANQIMKIDPEGIDEYKNKISNAMSLTDKMNIILGTVKGNLSQIAQIGTNFMIKVGSKFLPLINAVLVPTKMILKLFTSIPFMDWGVAIGGTIAAVSGMSVLFNNLIPTIFTFVNKFADFTNLMKDNDKSPFEQIFESVKRNLIESKEIAEEIVHLRVDDLERRVNDKEAEKLNKRLYKENEHRVLNEYFRQIYGNVGWSRDENVAYDANQNIIARINKNADGQIEYTLEQKLEEINQDTGRLETIVDDNHRYSIGTKLTEEEFEKIMQRVYPNLEGQSISIWDRLMTKTERGIIMNKYRPSDQLIQEQLHYNISYLDAMFSKGLQFGESRVEQGFPAMFADPSYAGFRPIENLNAFNIENIQQNVEKIEEAIKKFYQIFEQDRRERGEPPRGRQGGYGAVGDSGKTDDVYRRRTSYNENIIPTAQNALERINDFFTNGNIVISQKDTGLMGESVGGNVSLSPHVIYNEIKNNSKYGEDFGTAALEYTIHEIMHSIMQHRTRESENYKGKISITNLVTKDEHLGYKSGFVPETEANYGAQQFLKMLGLSSSEMGRQRISAHTKLLENQGLAGELQLGLVDDAVAALATRGQEIASVLTNMLNTLDSNKVDKAAIQSLQDTIKALEGLNSSNETVKQFNKNIEDTTETINRKSQENKNKIINEFTTQGDFGLNSDDFAEASKAASEATSKLQDILRKKELEEPKKTNSIKCDLCVLVSDILAEIKSRSDSYVKEQISKTLPYGTNSEGYAAKGETPQDYAYKRFKDLIDKQDDLEWSKNYLKKIDILNQGHMVDLYNKEQLAYYGYIDKSRDMNDYVLGKIKPEYVQESYGGKTITGGRKTVYNTLENILESTAKLISQHTLPDDLVLYNGAEGEGGGGFQVLHEDEYGNRIAAVSAIKSSSFRKSRARTFGQFVSQLFVPNGVNAVGTDVRDDEQEVTFGPGQLMLELFRDEEKQEAGYLLLNEELIKKFNISNNAIKTVQERKKLELFFAQFYNQYGGIHRTGLSRSFKMAPMDINRGHSQKGVKDVMEIIMLFNSVDEFLNAKWEDYKDLKLNAKDIEYLEAVQTELKKDPYQRKWNEYTKSRYLGLQHPTADKRQDYLVKDFGATPYVRLLKEDMYKQYISLDKRMQEALVEYYKTINAENPIYTVMEEFLDRKMLGYNKTRYASGLAKLMSFDEDAFLDENFDFDNEKLEEALKNINLGDAFVERLLKVMESDNNLSDELKYIFEDISDNAVDNVSFVKAVAKRKLLRDKDDRAELVKYVYDNADKIYALKGHSASQMEKFFPTIPRTQTLKDKTKIIRNDYEWISKEFGEYMGIEHPEYITGWKKQGVQPIGIKKQRALLSEGLIYMQKMHPEKYEEFKKKYYETHVKTGKIGKNLFDNRMKNMLGEIKGLSDTELIFGSRNDFKATTMPFFKEINQAEQMLTQEGLIGKISEKHKEALFKYYGTIDNLLKGNPEDIKNIKGIGYNEKNIQMFNHLIGQLSNQNYAENFKKQDIDSAQNQFLAYMALFKTFSSFANLLTLYQFEPIKTEQQEEFIKNYIAFYKYVIDNFAANPNATRVAASKDSVKTFEGWLPVISMFLDDDIIRMKNNAIEMLNFVDQFNVETFNNIPTAKINDNERLERVLTSETPEERRARIKAVQEKRRKLHKNGLLSEDPLEYRRKIWDENRRKEEESPFVDDRKLEPKKKKRKNKHKDEDEDEKPKPKPKRAIPLGDSEHPNSETGPTKSKPCNLCELVTDIKSQLDVQAAWFITIIEQLSQIISLIKNINNVNTDSENPSTNNTRNSQQNARQNTVTPEDFVSQFDVEGFNNILTTPQRITSEFLSQFDVQGFNDILTTPQKFISQFDVEGFNRIFANENLARSRYEDEREDQRQRRQVQDNVILPGSFNPNDMPTDRQIRASIFKNTILKPFKQMEQIIGNIFNRTVKKRAEGYEEAIDKITNVTGAATERLNAWKDLLEELSVVFPQLQIPITGLNIAIRQMGKVTTIIDKLNAFRNMDNADIITKFFGETIANSEMGQKMQDKIIGPVKTTLEAGITTAVMGAEGLMGALLGPLGIILVAVAAIAASVKLISKMHDDNLKKMQKQQDEYDSRYKAAKASYESAKSGFEKINLTEKEKNRAEIRYDTNKAKLEQANALKQSNAIKIQDSQNDSIWGEYGLRAAVQKSSKAWGLISPAYLLAKHFAGEFESTAGNYEGTSKNIREIRERTIGFNGTSTEKAIASYYDANVYAFAMMDEYKDELGQLYDYETKLIKMYGSQEAARESYLFQDKLSNTSDVTGLSEDNIKQYLSWMQTEHSVSVATNAMKAKAGQIVAETETKAMAVANGGDLADVMGLNGIHEQQKAMVKAQAEMIKQEAADTLWWKAFWSSLSAVFWAFMSPVTMVVNFLALIWKVLSNLGLIIYDAVTLGKGPMSDEDKIRLSEVKGAYDDFNNSVNDGIFMGREGQKARAYWKGYRELQKADLEKLGNESIDETDRANYGNDTSVGGAGYGAGVYTVPSTYDSFKQEGKSASQGFRDGLNQHSPGDIANAINDEFGFMTKFISDFSIGDVFRGVGQWATKGFKNGLNQHSPGDISQAVNGFSVGGALGSGIRGYRRDGALQDIQSRILQWVSKIGRDTSNMSSKQYGATEWYKQGHNNGKTGILDRIKNTFLYDQGIGLPEGVNPDDPEVKAEQRKRQAQTLAKTGGNVLGGWGLSRDGTPKGFKPFKIARWAYQQITGQALEDTISQVYKSIMGEGAETAAKTAVKIPIKDGTKQAAKTAVKVPTYYMGKEFLKEQNKIAAKRAAKSAGEIPTYYMGKEFLKEQNKKAAERAAKSAGKSGAKKIAIEGGDEAAEKIAINVGKKAAREGAETAAKKVGKEGAESAAKSVVKKAGINALKGAVPLIGPLITAGISAYEHNPFETHYNEDGTEKRALQSTGEFTGEVLGSIGAEAIQTLAAGNPLVGAAASMILEPLGEAVGGTIGWFADEGLNSILGLFGLGSNAKDDEEQTVNTATQMDSNVYNDFQNSISSKTPTGSFSGMNDIQGQTTNINNTGGSKTEINIQNININTQDDPESIKTDLMNMFIELQEEVTPKTVSRTVGGELGTTNTSANSSTQKDQYSQQRDSGNSGNQNPT